MTRDEIISDLKKQLSSFVNNDFHDRLWISNNFARIYVRKKGIMILKGERLTKFDFANISIHEDYVGQGIMAELLDWAINNLLHDIVVVESVTNERYLQHLLDCEWIKDIRPGYNNVFKYTKRWLSIQNPL